MKALEGRGGPFDFFRPLSTSSGEEKSSLCGVSRFRLRPKGTGRTIPTFVPGGINGRIISYFI
jgi:hypothetical protein